MLVLFGGVADAGGGNETSRALHQGDDAIKGGAGIGGFELHLTVVDHLSVVHRRDPGWAGFLVIGGHIPLTGESGLRGRGCGGRCRFATKVGRDGLGPVG